MGGSGISWAICKSAPCSRQITTPAPHHSVFTGRMPFLPPNQSVKTLKAQNGVDSVICSHMAGNYSDCSTRKINNCHLCVFAVTIVVSDSHYHRPFLNKFSLMLVICKQSLRIELYFGIAVSFIFFYTVL